ncbi:MAG: PIN domain-containing protein [Verrucomicrobia bacterium]|nr:PIN domain-containing protein [Verrucomicrobiota bacterium]
MAASPVLADSSFYIRWLRNRQDPLRALALAAAARDVAVCGVVRCEVGRALRQPDTRKRFRACWDVMINVPTDNRLWDEVERTLWDLDRQGRVLPLTDVVIACCAMRIGAVVLTFDHHFSEIPGVRAVNQLDV